MVGDGTSPTAISEVGFGIFGITDEDKMSSKLEVTVGGAEGGASTISVSIEPGLASRGLKRNIAQEKIRRGGSRKRSLLFQGFRPEMLSRRLSYRTVKSFCQLLLEFMAGAGTPADGSYVVVVVLILRHDESMVMVEWKNVPYIFKDAGVCILRFSFLPLLAFPTSSS